MTPGYYLSGKCKEASLVREPRQSVIWVYTSTSCKTPVVISIIHVPKCQDHMNPKLQRNS